MVKPEWGVPNAALHSASGESSVLRRCKFMLFLEMVLN